MSNVVGIIPTMSFIRKRKRNGKIYLEEVENVRVNGKVVQKHIKYIGREADNRTILSSSISNVSIESVKLHGPLLVLDYLAKKIGLAETLGEYGNEILSLVFAHCLDYKSVNQMSRWFERTDLNMLLNLDNLTEDRLLKSLDSIGENQREKIQIKIFEKIKKIYKLNDDGVVYDVTNTYLCGKQCSLGKLGKDKDGVKGRPLIQIGLGVTKSEGIPIFHKTFNGNISDSRTLHDLITLFGVYQVKLGLIVYDRGISSGSNIKAVKKLNIDTVCGLPSNNILKEKARKIIATKKLTSFENRVKLNKTVFYLFSQEHVLDGTKGTLLICYNEQKAKDLRESRYDEIKNAEVLIKEKKEIKSELKKYFNSDLKINLMAVNEDEEMDGFTFIFSTKKLPANDIINIYFHDKDIVEKAFHSIKGVIKVRPVRHWLYDRVTAHIFICYLSYLLLSLLRLSIKKLNMSPMAALQELGSLYKVYMRDNKKDFKVSRTVALTKIQEKILRAIDKKLLTDCSG